MSFFILPSLITAQDRAQAIDKYLTAKTDLGRFSGAVLVAEGDTILLRKGYGLADAESDTPFTPDTKFMVASITKMFTAMAVLQLRDENKLRLDDSVCKYIEACPAAWNAVTIENVLRHRSGIPDYESKLKLGSEKYFEFFSKPKSTERILNEAKASPLNFMPGEKFEYSNTGYILLAGIVEKVSGKSFDKYIESRILKPAKMMNSGMFDADNIPGDLANGYTHETVSWDKFLPGISLTSGHLKKTPRLDFPENEGDAALYSTLDDLFRWSRVMDGKSSLVTPALAREIFDPKGGYYGYGWFVLEEFDQKRLWHNGTLPGFVSDFVKFPEKDLTIILFTNIDRARLGITTRDVSSIALGKPFDMPVRGSFYQLKEKDIKALEGDYKTADGKSLKVKNEPDYFTGYMNDADGNIEFIAGWIPMSPTEFYFPMKDGKVTFFLDKNGKAEKVNMRYRGEDHFASRTVETEVKVKN
ncbi:MAG: serine hydrolase domain-containing protein [Pyrinomonadaceae bacterium]